MERRISEEEVMFLNKKGVSIVAVLLFMMVATIAGTAAFKWLTSEGRSSASRMAQQSAYSAAMAGIDNARAWMTNNGHDVGGLVRQYFEGGKNPILLDNVLSGGCWSQLSCVVDWCGCLQRSLQNEDSF